MQIFFPMYLIIFNHV